MAKNVLLALKPGVDNDRLCATAQGLVSPAEFRLVSLVVVGTDDDERQRLEAARTELARLAATFASDVRTQAELIEMRPGSRVVALADEEHTDLLIIGLARRSRVGKALLGSDAQTILLGASCPVLSTRLD